MKTLKYMSIQIQPDTTGTALGKVRSNITIVDDSYNPPLEVTISADETATDPSDAQALFNSVLAAVKSRNGL